MRKKSTFVLGLLIVIGLFGYAVTYQVRFTEAAVVTTFGKADEGDVVVGSKTEGGVFGNLYMKWPWPIQKVRTYDTRVRTLELKQEEIQTADGQTIVIGLYTNWRVDDPLSFFRVFGTEATATSRIRDWLRDAQAEARKFKFDDFLKSGGKAGAEDGSPMEDAEEAILGKLREIAKKTSEKPGLQFESVGIRMLTFHEAVANQAIETMKENRQRLAENARTRGKADARRIVESARSQRRTILAYVNAREKAIRSEGEREAAKYYATFAKAPGLYRFLRQLDAEREIMKGGKATILLDQKEGWFQSLRDGAGNLGKGVGPLKGTD